MESNLYPLIQKPLYQALLFLLLTPILIVVFRPKSTDSAWLIAACTFALFLMVNAGMLWFADSPWHYFFYSIGSAVGYLVLTAIMMPAVLRVLRLDGSGESATAFLILIYQPFALLLVMFARWIATKWF